MHSRSERGAIVRRLLFVAAALLAAVLVFVGATLPPRAQEVASADDWSASRALTIAGAIHVHSDRSDGTGSIEEIAAAAHRAGLQFLYFADHGDGTRPPIAPAYRAGVLCLDGVEISTEGGHYVALGMGPAPYPLAGEARDVVDDVGRLGGFGVVAHPGSARAELEWSDWNLPIDAIEWLNADSEWRDEAPQHLVFAALRYAFRPRETLASVFDRPDEVLRQWDRLTAQRPVVSIAAPDAHARIGLGGEDDDERAVLLRAPSYETAFRAFAVRLRLDGPLSRDPLKDSASVLAALRAGHAYTGIDALASPPLVEFTAHSGQTAALYGDTLAASGDVRFTARIAPPDGSELVLLRNGTPVRTSRTGELQFDTDSQPAAYRVEARLDRAPGTPPVPWIVTNPIYVGARAVSPDTPQTSDPPGPPAARPAPVRWLYREGDPDGWTIEHQADSRGAINVESRPGGARRAIPGLPIGPGISSGGVVESLVEPEGPQWEIRFRYALNSVKARGPYAALVRRLAGITTDGTAVTFRAHADRATRVSVQLRAPGQPEDRRWRRSIYLDQNPRDVRIELADMRPVGRTTPSRPAPPDPDALLFVVDATNTTPGTAGAVWVSDVRVEK